MLILKEKRKNKNLFKLLLISIFLLFILVYSFAYAISKPYSPGETLDPSCAPGEINCTVSISNSGAVTFPNLTSKGLVINDTSGVLGTTTGVGFVKDDGTGNITYDNSSYYLSSNPLNYISNATGLLSAGVNVTITGNGTLANPYVINSSGGASGVSSINSDISTTQTLSVGTSGNNFSITDSGNGVHVFNLPTASATNRGALSSTDWSVFNGKQNTLVSGTNIKTLNSNSLLGSGDLSIAALIGFTPYNGVTNPNGYITTSELSGYATQSWVSGQDYLTTELEPNFNSSIARGITSGNISSWNAKQNAITVGTINQYLRGDLSLATFPTNISSFNNDIGYATTSSLSNYLPLSGGIVTGNINMAANIIPTSNNIYSLGSPSMTWKDIYVGPGSLYVNGQEVVHTDPSNNVNITADSNQSLLLSTFGTGDIQLNPSGSGQVALKGNVNISGGKFIRSSDASGFLVDDDIKPFISGAFNLGSSSIKWNNIYANKFVTTSGTSSQFVKGDGTLDSTAYYPASNPNSYISSITSSNVTTALGYTPYNSANPSNYIALTAISSTATGLTYNNSTGTFSLTSGYGIPTSTQITNWNNAYANQITSLTTVGSSGSATLSTNILNIPTYTLSGLGGQPLNTNLTSIAGLTNVAGVLANNGTGTFSYTSTPTLTGTNFSGIPYSAITGTVPTWNQSTTGNAATATNLTGLTATIANLNTVTGALGSNAFTSTAYYPASNPNGYITASSLSGYATTSSLASYLPLTGGSLSGTITASNLIGTNTGDETTSSIETKLGVASSGNDGYLSGTDWTTFNNKQNALINPITGTGTNSQIAFWNGTNTQTGSSNLTWDNSNKRLGIGLTPSHPLDISTGTTSDNSAINAVGSINDYFQMNIQNTSTGIGAQSGYSATADNGTSTTGFAWMGINNSNFSNPQPYNIGGSNDVSFMGFGNDMYISNANTGKSLIFTTGLSSAPYYTERMRILNNGNVGIGTSSPSYTLDINGNARATSFITSGGISSQFVKGDGTLDSNSYLTNATGLISAGTNVTITGSGTSGSPYVINSTGSGGSSSWNGITNPTANQSLAMGAYTSLWTYGAATGASVNPFSITDTTNNTGTGNLVNISTAAGSTLNPFAVNAKGTSALQILANGSVGIGTTSPSGLLTLAGNKTAAAWGLNGINLQTVAATYTDNSTAASTTVGNNIINSFGVPTLAASNTGVTYTNAPTLYIAGAPTAGTNVSITNPYALYVNSGTSYFAGAVYGLGGIQTTNTASISNFFANGSTGISTNQTTSSLLFGGAAGVQARAWFAGSNNSTLSANDSYGNVIVGSSPIGTAATGTHALIANLVVNPIGTVTSGGATVTGTASLYIAGAGTGGTSNYALYVNSGASYFNGGSTFNGLATLSAGITTLATATGNFSVASGAGLTSAQGAAIWQFGGSTSVQARAIFSASSGGNLSIGASYSNVLIASSPVVAAASGTHGWLANEVINPIGTVTSGGATVTNTATLYVNGAGSGGTNNYSLYVGGTAKSFIGGSVGIATAGLPAYTLDVGSASVSGIVAQFTNSTGYCTINPTTTSLSCTSDINLKKNIINISDNQPFVLQTGLSGITTLDKLAQLTAVQYNWKSEADTDPKHTGFIAQQVEQLFPDLVATDSTTGLKSVNYNGLTPYLTEAIKEMDIKINVIPSYTDISMYTKINNFLKGIAERGEAIINTVTSINVNTQNVNTQNVNTNELCVGSTCVTPDQFLQIVNQSKTQLNKSTYVSNPATTNSTAPVNTPAAPEAAPSTSSSTASTTTDSSITSNPATTNSTAPAAITSLNAN